MSKQTIAVDIDDVLAATTDAVRLFVNKKFALNLQEDHYRVKAKYWGYYESVWGQHDLDGDGILDEFHAQYSVDQSHVEVLDGAKYALHKLSKRFRLVAVSSRTLSQQLETENWIKHEFGDVFDVVRCIDSRNAKIEKGTVCRELGARILIDDNVQHCLSAINEGVSAILFGEYGWHHETEIPQEVVRCANWDRVLEYFDGRS